MSRGDRHTTAPKYRVRALGGFDDSRLGCERSRVRFPDGPFKFHIRIKISIQITRHVKLSSTLKMLIAVKPD